MNRLTRIGTVAALAAVSTLAASQGAVTKAASQAEADKAINARQAIFKDLKDLNAPIGEMLRRQKPIDPALVATNAAKIAELGAKIPAAYLVDTRGFTATKTGALDGIWASAPYFHNGSVPTLWHVLHPDQRPRVWKRTEDGYDQQRVGLEVEELDAVPRAVRQPAHRRRYFDTTLPGKNPGGHMFPEQLTEDEKQAVLEYLKSL